MVKWLEGGGGGTARAREGEGDKKRIYSIGECHAILLVVNSNNIIPGVHIARC
jgi:hypothetical protein